MYFRFQHAFTEQTATLSSTIITQLVAAQQVSTKPAIPVGVNDTMKGGITDHDARSARLPTERPSITPTVRPLAQAPSTTVTPTTLPNEDYHIGTKLSGSYIAPGFELAPRHPHGPQIWKLACDTYRHLSARRHNATLKE
jgi:hypothetical protein